MLIWIIQDGEPLPGMNPGSRDWRCGILAKTLVAHGHEVLWWASTFDYVQKKHWYNTPQTIGITPALQMRLLHGPGYGQSKSPKRFMHNRILGYEFAREARSARKPDVVLASLPTLELAEQAVVYGQETGVPVLVDVRDLWPDHYLTLVPQRLQGLLRLVLRSEFRRAHRLLRGATGITAISQTFLRWGLRKAEREQKGTDSVFAMGYPASSLPVAQIQVRQDELLVNLQIKQENLVVAFVGSLNSVFDFQTVIEAARSLQRTDDANVQFIIVGDGDRRSSVHTWAQDLGNTVLTGWLDQVSVAAILGLADVGLAPYSESQSINGSLPNKVFEYMSVGLPVLSSLKGDFEVLVREEQIGLQYQSGNTNSLIEQIRWLIAYPKERQTMGQRAHRLFEKRFRADVVYAAMVRHIEDVASLG